MAKRLVAKIDTYEKDGQTKGKYVEVGVILPSDNGEYALIHPHIDFAGLLIQQRLLNPGKAGKSVLCSIFENDGGNRPTQNSAPSSPAPASDADFDDDIPF